VTGRDVLVRVRVTPNAKRAMVVRVAEASYEVKVDARAEGGRANKRLVEILSEHLDVPKSRISLVKGARSRDKVVEVDFP
jgi:uncharacterized protein